MAGIVKSSWFRDEDPQKDGRFRITETHTDHLGNQYQNAGLYDAKYDPDEELAVRAKIIEDTLRGVEIAAAVDEMTAKPEPVKPTRVDPAVAAKLKYATAQELMDAVAGTADAAAAK